MDSPENTIQPPQIPYIIIFAETLAWIHLHGGWLSPFNYLKLKRQTKDQALTIALVFWNLVSYKFSRGQQ